MHDILHPIDGISRLYMSRKEGGRGLASIEDSVDVSIWQLEENIKKCQKRHITATRNSTDNININRTTITRKQNWEEKQLYGYFKRQIDNISHEKSSTWLRKGNFMRETESVQIAAENNAIKTNYVKAKINKTHQYCKCRLCWFSGDRDETILHIINECSTLGQREIKIWYNCEGKVIYWELCMKFTFDQTNKWNMRKSESIPKNEMNKIFETQTDHWIPARRTDLVMVNKKENLLNSGVCLPDRRQSEWK